MAALGLLGHQLQGLGLSSLGKFNHRFDNSACRKGHFVLQSMRALKKQQQQSSGSKGSSGKGSVAEKSKFESGSRGGEERAQVGRKKQRDSGPSYLKIDENVIASLPMPKPPAGFLLDEAGRVVLVAPAANRVVTIVDPATQRPLECMIRRAFRSSRGQDCLLLLPLDMPLQILQIEDESEGLRELSDDELQAILPAAAYALAKRRLHLIVSGFCLTARGGFCYTEEHVLDLNTGTLLTCWMPKRYQKVPDSGYHSSQFCNGEKTMPLPSICLCVSEECRHGWIGELSGFFSDDNGEGLGGSLAEGVEIANFQVDDDEYLIYTPFDPLMFVARRVSALLS